MKPIVIDGPHGPIAAAECGDGQPVALIAGVGSTRRIWGGLPGLLGRHFRVVVLDNRGVGGSRGGASFTLASAVEDVLSVMDSLNHHRFGLLGASLGALIAVGTALRAPQRVDRLVAVSGAAHLSTHGRRALELLLDLMRNLPPERIGPALMSLAFAPPSHERAPALVAEASELYGLLPEDLPGTLRQLEHLLQGWDLRPQLPALDVPALVISGLRDPIVAAEDTAELARLLPRCELVELGHAGHSVLAEGGAQVLDTVISFLTRGPRPAADPDDRC